jgi:hypothetical protein
MRDAASSISSPESGVWQLPSSYCLMDLDVPLTSSAAYLEVLFELSNAVDRMYPVPPSQVI